MAQTVVVVGGSISGLMHALQLKREGHDVTILERSPSSIRSSHHAGVSYRASMEEFLGKYDDTGVAMASPTGNLHFAYRRWPNVYDGKLKYQMTSWGLLYRILRANFDGLSSAACPDPPLPRQGDGKAAYLVGRQVVGLLPTDNSQVAVSYSNVVDGKMDTMVADLVIGADGSHSKVRDIVEAHSSLKYSGYVAWRGTVPERNLSEASANYFLNGFSFNVLNRSYIIWQVHTKLSNTILLLRRLTSRSYIIPTDDGGFGPGERLVNWVWYYNVAENSADMSDIFIDIEGKYHSSTVPRGLVSPTVWDRIRATGASQMSLPFVELLNETDAPFVTKVSDVLTTKARFWDDRVFLVGDALATFRPHVAMATEQAAKHCLGLGNVRNGSLSLDTWEQDTTRFAKRIWLLSRLVGELGQGSFFAFAWSVIRYLTYLVKLKVWR